MQDFNKLIETQVTKEEVKDFINYIDIIESVHFDIINSLNFIKRLRDSGKEINSENINQLVHDDKIMLMQKIKPVHDMNAKKENFITFQGFTVLKLFASQDFSKTMHEMTNLLSIRENLKSKID